MSTQRSASSKETHIKLRSKSVNRRLALSESAKNKQTFEFTNRGISSVLTLAQPRRRDLVFLPRGTQTGELNPAPRTVEMKQLPAHQTAPRRPVWPRSRFDAGAAIHYRSPPLWKLRVESERGANRDSSRCLFAFAARLLAWWNQHSEQALLHSGTSGNLYAGGRAVIGKQEPGREILAHLLYDTGQSARGHHKARDCEAREYPITLAAIS